jgi:hypothetical protein
MKTIEVFTCDCYPEGEIVRIIHRALRKAGGEYTLKEYNIEKNPEEYSDALDRYGHPFGFEDCINLFIDGSFVRSGKPSVEELLNILHHV